MVFGYCTTRKSFSVAPGNSITVVQTQNPPQNNEMSLRIKVMFELARKQDESCWIREVNYAMTFSPHVATKIAQIW